MKIYFVRHGHPDYVKDCLTDLGHKQGEAVAERLKNEKIDKFYSSSSGRAYETALHIAEGRGMEVEKLDFMRELGWGPVGGEPDGEYSPWALSRKMVSENMNLNDPGWSEDYPFNTSFVSERALKLGTELDKWLEGLGVVRDGNFYRVINPKYENVLLASHGGASSAAFSRIFNLPFSLVCGAMLVEFTSVTIVEFEGKGEELVSPKLRLFNDAKHIEGVTTENIFGQ